MASDNGIIPGGGKVVLPLLALGGIALWINYYYKKRPTVDETKEDYLSQLPDDVLSSILGNLTVRDAARTTILSTSWKHVFSSMHHQQQQPTLVASIPTFEFRCFDMLRVDTSSLDCCSYYQEKDKFMNELYQFSKFYSGRRVAQIKMVCCFCREFPSAFSHWFRSISRLGVERLHLSFQCRTSHYTTLDSSKLLKFSLEVLSQISSLKHLFLSNCVVSSSPKVRFNSLITVSLKGVVLTSGHLEGILSSCSNLKRLTIECCILPYKLRLTGAVTKVVILYCDGAKEIDLHAAYLHTFECKIMNDVRFFFSFVPMLENVMISPYWEHPFDSYIIGDRARDIRHQVKSLTLTVYPEQEDDFPIEIPTEMKIFRNLRKLSLILVTNGEILEIIELSTLWDACPLLQDLSFVVRKVYVTKEIRRRPPLFPTCHTKLKQVTYGGFNGYEAEMKFVLYILRSATVLERMFLSPGFKNYFCCADHTYANFSFDERKRNSIQQKLHGQAISKKAVVIIQ